MIANSYHPTGDCRQMERLKGSRQMSMPSSRVNVKEESHHAQAMTHKFLVVSSNMECIRERRGEHDRLIQVF